MTLGAGATVWTNGRRRLQLGPLLKSGGAGSVYPVVESPAQVAKIYHEKIDHAQGERKVAAMLELSPHLPDLIEDSRRYVQIAWPQALLQNDHGRFVGFLMPAIDVKSTSELECILQERQARANQLPNGLGAKITLAANLAAVIAELHKHGHHVVDLKPVNVRFYPQTLYMAMLDCDGFSIQGRGERFLAEQITPDYLAPEFQNRPIPPEAEEQQDRFALAVVIFQLLNFGIHPFTGRPSNDRVPTDIPGRIAQRCYAYGPIAHAQLGPSPVSGHLAMPADIRQQFDRAFTGETARPAAPEWAALLKSYAQRSNQRLSQCSRDRHHHHFSGLPCAACARVALIANTARDSATAKAASSALRSSKKSVAAAKLGIAMPQQRSAPSTKPGAASLATRSLHVSLQFSTTTTAGVLTRPIHLSPSGQRARACVLVAIPIAIAWILWLIAAQRSPAMRMVTPFRHPPPEQIGASVNPQVGRKAYAPPASIESIKNAIQVVADAMLSGDAASEASAMASLRSTAASYPLPPHSHYQDDFANFAGNLAGENDAAAEPLRIDLEGAYSREHHNSEAAYDLGWLALYRRDPVAANSWFARSIGDDPGNVQAWCGYGVAAGSDSDTISTMAVAESLQPGFLASAMNNRFPPELLRRAGIDPDHMTLMATRARGLAAALSGSASSPNTRAPAGQ